MARVLLTICRNTHIDAPSLIRFKANASLEGVKNTMIEMRNLFSKKCAFTCDLILSSIFATKLEPISSYFHDFCKATSMIVYCNRIILLYCFESESSTSTDFPLCFLLPFSAHHSLKRFCFRVREKLGNPRKCLPTKTDSFGYLDGARSLRGCSFRR